MKRNKALTGLSAGQLRLSPQEPADSMTASTFLAAKNLDASNRSEWILTKAWSDGTTLWTSPAKNQQALVSDDGFVSLLFIPDQNEW